MGGTATPGMFNFAAVCAMGGDAERARMDAIGARLEASDPINIQFTSGTTGMPKGATLAHKNILNNAWFAGRTMHFAPQDVLCIPVPMYHCFGMVLGTLLCVSHGATMVLPSEVFEPAGSTAGSAGRTLHRVARRADHVHRRTRLPGLP